MDTMKITPFRYDADNISYVVSHGKSAAVVDGGAVDAILAHLSRNQLSLKYVINTHAHPDHTKGNQRLLSTTQGQWIEREKLIADGGLFMDGELLEAIPTPGHTMDSVTFHFNGVLITGDTLFNGTVGNCFSGDFESFYRSISRLSRFPDDTLVYAGHDYVGDSMAAARYWEPDNPAIESYLAKYDPNHVVSTMGDERLVNPYLRFNEPGIVAQIRQRGLSAETALDRWISFMKMG